MKHLNDLTIAEYEQFKTLVEANDIFGIFLLFGENAEDMPYDEFEKMWTNIKSQTLSTSGVKREYKIGNRTFHASLNPLKLKAGQFIDFQNYLQDFKVHKVLSVFLIPMERKGLFRRLTSKKYNTDYDIYEVQTYLYNNMTIGEANELSNFFLKWSMILLKTMKDSSEKKFWKMRKARVKSEKKRLKINSRD